MALLFIDGFDAGDTSLKWTVNTGSSSATTRFGTGQSFRLTGIGTSYKLAKSVTASSKVVVGFAYNTTLLSQSIIGFNGDTAATNHINIAVSATGALQILRGASVIATSATTPILANAWNYIEVSATVSDTVGAVDVRCNGNSVVTFSGDTKNGGTADTIDYVGFYFNSVTGGCNFDDLYVNDGTGGAPYNTFLGDVRVYTTSPSGAGNTTQFTPSAGSNYQTVDELPYSAADYNTGTTPGLKDTYAMGDIPADVNTVYAVGTNVIAKKTDAGSIAVRPVIRSGGTDYVGSSATMAASDALVTDLRTTNPATSTAWTAANVNNLEGGMEIV